MKNNSESLFHKIIQTIVELTSIEKQEQVINEAIDPNSQEANARLQNSLNGIALTVSSDGIGVINQLPIEEPARTK